jgi:hypothetical protein
MAEALSASLRGRIEFVDGPEEEAREDLQRSGIPPFIIEKVLFYFRTVREGRWHDRVRGGRPAGHDRRLEGEGRNLHGGRY